MFHSPFLIGNAIRPHRPRRVAQPLKTHSSLLPPVPLAQCLDVRSVMASMPIIHAKHPINGSQAVLGMPKGSGEICAGRCAEKPDPSFMERVEQRVRGLERSASRIFE